MNSESWQQVKELFEAALERGGAERTVFLEQACKDKGEIRREVESLLAAHDGDSTFMNTPVGNLLAAHKLALTAGQRFGHYEEISLLGEGGMGQIYLAVDTRLGRKVALKLLPSSYANDADRARRLELEARAASALNHPNIITIHEIGVTDSVHFMALEFVDGETLRERMTNSRMTVGEVLDVAVQVASALQAAHEAGIVHRDIKPENIMLRRDGVVKVLDFGLAKLTVQAELTEPIRSMVQTNAGVIMGTVAYMSPEQAQGHEIDSRTDAWSLGIVLYEMVAGRTPFTGKTPRDAIVSITAKETPPLPRDAQIPAELERIIATALTKEKSQRYQSAGDLAKDLRNLKEELTLEARLSQFRREEKGSTKEISLNGGAHAAETSALQSHPTSSAEYLATEINTHRALAFAALVIVVCGAIGVTYFFRNRSTSNLFSKSATLISATDTPTPNQGTTNEEAYRYYVQGKNLYNERQSELDKKALENFEQAIRLDPNFARAYVGLAKAYHGMAGLGSGSPRIVQEKAKQAVKKALELDNNLGEAYAVRGIINFSYEWDFVAAETDLRTAIELEPSNATVQWGHAFLCAYSGRFAQALKEIETAQTLEPGTGIYERDRGRILYYSRRYDEAIVQFIRSLELKQAGFSIWLVRSYEMKGDYSAAFETFIKGQKDPQRIEAYRTAYEAAGWQSVKRKVLEFSLLDEQKGVSVALYQIATAFAQLGEKDQAFAYLNKLVEERSWTISTLNVDPQLDPLRGDPRFTQLLKHIRH